MRKKLPTMVATIAGIPVYNALVDDEGTGMLRVSFAPYNTLQEAEYLMESLERAIKMLEG